LDTRFELSRFIGKTLLVGRDVPGTFLNFRSAGVIKKLVGNDLLNAEKKSINGTFPIMGVFNIIITSNSRLHLKLDSDTEAWRRRLLIVDYNRPKPQKVISEFDKFLLRTEGPGILSWAVEGAVKLLQDLSEGDGQLKMSDAQKERVEILLNESDSVRAFISECIVVDTESNITVTELQEHYCAYCEKQGWIPKIQHTFSKESPNVIMEKFGRPLSTDIRRVGRNQRGYRYLKYVAPE
jgi:phage/plasmid-associated DNA primase